MYMSAPLPQFNRYFPLDPNAIDARINKYHSGGLRKLVIEIQLIMKS